MLPSSRSPLELQQSPSLRGVWNLAKPNISPLNVKGHQRRALHRYITAIANDGKSVVFCERVCGSPNLAHHARFRLHGQIESQGSTEFPYIEGSTKHYEMKVAPGDYGRDHGEVPLWTYVWRGQAPSSGPPSDIWRVLHVSYNTQSNQLEVKEQQVEDLTRSGPGDGDFFFWKDVAYFGSSTTASGRLKVMDLKQSVCRDAAMSFSDFVDERMGDLDPDLFKPIVLGDERFLIHLRGDYYVIWCFDKNITMSNEIKEYGSWMREQRKRRTLSAQRNKVGA